MYRASSAVRPSETVDRSIGARPRDENRTVLLGEPNGSTDVPAAAGFATTTGSPRSRIWRRSCDCVGSYLGQRPSIELSAGSIVLRLSSRCRRSDDAAERLDSEVGIRLLPNLQTCARLGIAVT